MSKIEISSEKTFQGAWKLSARYHGNLVTRQYIGYTKKEATRMFKQALSTA